MTGRLRSAVLAAACALAAVPSAGLAAPEHLRLDLSYDVFVGGLHAGRLDAVIRLDPPKYAFDVHAKTLGLLEALVGWRMDSYSRGQLARERVVPAEAGQKNRRRGRKRFVDIVFAEGMPRVVRAKPESRADGRERVLPEARRGALDPIGGVLAIITALDAGGSCDAAFPVFDGRRLYDLAIRGEGSANLPASRYTPYSGPAMRCQILFRQKAGFKQDSDGTVKRFRTAADLWMGRAFAGVPRLPVRIEFDTRLLGAVVGHLVRVSYSSPHGGQTLE